MRVPKVCRLCMSKDNLVAIFGDNSFNSDDVLQASGVQVKTDDGLPQNICSKCTEDLKHILDFREKCKNTEKQLIFLKTSLESETDSCDSVDIKEEPLEKVEDVGCGINIKFEKSESEGEDKVRSTKSVERVKQNMPKHLVMVHMEGFKCIYCRKKYNTRTDLMKHLKSCIKTCPKKVLYTGELIKCNICHIILTRGQLNRHRRNKHSDLLPICQHPNDHKAICDICELKFYSRDALIKHKQKHYMDEHFEITSIDNSTPLMTEKDVLRDRARDRGPKKYKVPKVFGVSRVLIKSLTEVEEHALARWMIQMQERQFVLDKTSIFNSIEKMIGDQEVPQSHIISWINDFLDKHPEIEVRETKKLEVCNKIGMQIKKWFGNMEEFLVKHELRGFMDDPGRIFAADERLFFTTTYNNKYKLVQDKSHNVLFTVNAAAVLAPPMIVFAYKEVPIEVMKCVPDKWGVRRSDNGIMCCDNFFEYIRDVFNPWLDEADVKRPVVLFLDAHTSFLTLHLYDFCFQNGVELVALYPYSNDISPIELGLFKPLNNLWQKAISKEGGEFPKVCDLAPLLKDVVSKIPINTIKKGFLKAGLFPIDFNNIDIPKQATVKRYDYLRNTFNVPKKQMNAMPQVRSETRVDSPKLGEVCKVYLSKKQLLERKVREEKEVKVKVENDLESVNDFKINENEGKGKNKERKAFKRKTQEKLKFESSEESE